MEKIGYIYKIVNPRGNIYIGKTIRLKERIANYKYCSGISEQKMLYNSIKKYGWENHVFEILDQITEDKLSELEIFYIEKYNTYHYNNEQGMNLTKGGEGASGRIDSFEVRKKRADKIRGRKHTEYTKKLMSELKKGKPSNKKGIPHSEQVKQKISQANKGKIPTKETIKTRNNTRLLNLIYKHESILQINKINNNIIKEWIMLPKDIAKILNICDTNIVRCLNNKKEHTFGCIWKYKK
jgi:group I intron endonuclease